MEGRSHILKPEMPQSIKNPFQKRGKIHYQQVLTKEFENYHPMPTDPNDNFLETYIEALSEEGGEKEWLEVEDNKMNKRLTSLRCAKIDFRTFSGDQAPIDEEAYTPGTMTLQKSLISATQEMKDQFWDNIYLDMQFMQKNRLIIGELAPVIPKLIYKQMEEAVPGVTLTSKKRKYEKLVLLLDLDQTLILSHPSAGLAKEGKHLLHYTKYGIISFLLRPHCLEVLKRLKKLYHIFISTASVFSYAEEIVKVIEKELVGKKGKFFDGLITREECIEIDEIPIKRLLEEAEESRTICVDDTFVYWVHAPNNYVPVTPFTGDKDDDGLLPVANYLEGLANVRGDLRDMNQICFGITQRMQEIQKEFIQEESLMIKKITTVLGGDTPRIKTANTYLDKSPILTINTSHPQELNDLYDNKMKTRHSTFGSSTKVTILDDKELNLKIKANTSGNS